MDAAAILAAIRALPLAERLRIFAALQDDLGPEPRPPQLTEAQREELRRRVADDDAFPDDVIPWEEAIAKTRARLRGGRRPRAGQAHARGIAPTFDAPV